MAPKIINFNLKTFILIIPFCLFPTIVLPQQTFHVEPDKSSAKFTSNAPLNTFEGRTKNISGWVTFNPQNLTSAKGSFLVDLESINTANRLRNKHMREKFLHTQEYPHMKFELARITSPSHLKYDQPQTVTATGHLSLHGVTKPQQVSVTVTHHPQKNELKIQGSFSVMLSDFDIKQPSFMGLFVENTLPVTVNLTLSAQ